MAEPMSRHTARGIRVAAALAVLATGALASGCATRHPGPISAQDLQELQTFPYFRVYWAGPTFENRAVTAADARKGYSTSLGDSVEYGDCDPGKGVLHTGGCVLPLEITTVVWRPHCNGALGAQRNILIRGVPATVYDGGDSIEIYTGRVAIDVAGDSPQRTLSAAQSVRALNAGGSATATLPLPAFRPGLVGSVPHYRVDPSVPIAERHLAARARRAERHLRRLLGPQQLQEALQHQPQQQPPPERSADQTRLINALLGDVAAAKPLKC
jgi:hypothetical protein